MSDERVEKIIREVLASLPRGAGFGEQIRRLENALEQLARASRSSPAPRPEMEEIERLVTLYGFACVELGAAAAGEDPDPTVAPKAALLSAVRRLRAGPEDATRLREAARAFVAEWDADPKAPCGENWTDVFARLMPKVTDLRAALSSPAPRCHCTYEAGDSPCPMHGMDEDEGPLAPSRPAKPWVNLPKRAAPSPSASSAPAPTASALRARLGGMTDEEKAGLVRRLAALSAEVQERDAKGLCDACDGPGAAYHAASGNRLCPKCRANDEPTLASFLGDSYRRDGAPAPATETPRCATPCDACRGAPADPALDVRERMAIGQPLPGMCCEWSRLRASPATETAGERSKP
jgi:hypothetical protein